MSKKPDSMRPANDISLTSLVTEHSRQVHVPGSDEKFAASMRMKNEEGRFYSQKFNDLILSDERIEDCPPIDVRILDVDIKVPSYDVLRGVLERHWDLDLYNIDRLIEDYGKVEDAGVFSYESRNLFPFGPSVIIVTHAVRNRDMILIDAAEALGFKLQRYDRIFHGAPHHF